MLACVHRYLYTHGLDMSLVDMVDQVATPLVNDVLTALTHRKLDTWPTPADYAHAVSTCAHAAQGLNTLTCSA
jgi:hypothetical protein